MKKKIYYVISFLVIILIFSVAAICNQCSIIQPTTTSNIESSETVKNTEQTSASKETSSVETTSSEKTQEQNEKAQENHNPVL